MVAASRKVRFITAFSPSQPSRPSRRPPGARRAAGSGTGVEAPDQQRVVVGDEPERSKPGGFHPAGDEEAEGLVGVAAGEAVEAEMRAIAAREGLGQEPSGARQAADLALQGEPCLHVGRKAAPGLGIGEQFDDPVREERRGGELGAGVDGDARHRRGLARDLDRHLAQRLVAHGLAAEEEGVAGHEGCSEVLLHLAEQSAAPAPEAHLEHFGLDDGADVHADRPGAARVAQPPAVVVAGEALPAVVGLQRVAAGGGESRGSRRSRTGQAAVGTGAADLVEERVGVERAGAGGQQDVLAQHVERAGAARRSVQVVGVDRLERGAALEHLEAVGGHEDGAGGRVVAVVGAADALDQPLDVLGRADLHDEVDVAPVDAEIEAAGRDDGAKLARDHGRLDAEPGLARERAVVERDGEALGVLGPERLEEELGLGAGVDEDEGGGGAADEVHHRGRGVARGLAGPGQRRVGLEDADEGLRARIGQEDARALAEVGGERRRVLDGGGEADTAQSGRERLEPGEAEHELVAPLRFRERVDFVDDHPGEAAEDARRLLVGEHQGEGLRRRQQDVRRVDALAGTLGGPGVAGAVLDPDRQAHLGDGGAEVAADVGGERLERRDVEGVEAGGRGGPELDQARQEARQRLAAAGRGDEQRCGVCGPGEKRELVGMGLPAAPGEPAGEGFWKGNGRGAHAGGVVRRGPASRAGELGAKPPPRRKAVSSAVDP